MTQDRKRGGSSQEDEVPLSKRIKNLHINNGVWMEGANPVAAAEWGPGPPSFAHLPESPPSSVQSLDWNIPQYSPDLNENQNPHYFNINKLLFEMYVERLQRGCHQVL